MIDEEVEIVLREIRERVKSQPVADPSPALGNGDGTSQVTLNEPSSARNSEALARLNAHLTTTARAWDRLPPIISNRSGFAARFEIWIKARMKAFSRWFTWEQVNFNAAVHHALGETLQTLSNQEAAIAALRAQAESELAERRTEIDALRAQLQKETNALRGELRGEAEAGRIRAEDQEAQLRAVIETQTAELASELRERDDRLENEQRVCFKQLSLEASEADAFQDRAQRRTNTLLDELDQRVRQIEESRKRP
jgi:Skp family chaperone for outer membrane proteins